MSDSDRWDGNLAPRVLVVDDDDETRWAIRALLEQEGYAVEEATNGRTALDRLEQLPTPALILLDLMMPTMSGQMLLRELEDRPDMPPSPIIVMTASDADAETSSLAVPMLRKPLDASALIQLVEQYAPRFWDDEEAPTEQRPLEGDSEAPDTVVTPDRGLGEMT